jgi:hypothetical protein
MRSLAALLALSAACAGASAVEIRNYDTRIDVDRDGAALASATVELAGAAAGRFRLPVGFAKISEFRPVDPPAGVTMAARGSADAAWIEVELPEGVPAELKLAFSFRSNGVMFVPKPEQGQKPTLPEGSRLLRHRFVNTQEAPIGRYAATVLFPRELIAHRITEQTPKPGRKEFIPRVELDRFDGRQGALLQLANVRQGDRASMELEVVDGRRSLMWLAALLPLAAGYLFAFRDLVKPGTPKA